MPLPPNILAIDTETGGLDPSRHALLSLAAVPSWDAEPFHVYILAEGEVDDEACKVNGYTPELWQQRKAIPLRRAMEAFRCWLAACPRSLPLAHNAAFDKGFLEAAERRTGITGLNLDRRWRCSMITMLALQDVGVLPQRSYASLNNLGSISGFWEKERRSDDHDALQDARVCLHGYDYLLNLITKKEGGAADLL